jgi:hypothetical protein
MGEKIHLFHMLNVGNVTLNKISLGYKNYSLKYVHHFLIETLKFRFFSHCEVLGLHSIVHKHQCPLRYGKSTWHHAQKLQSFL